MAYEHKRNPRRVKRVPKRYHDRSRESAPIWLVENPSEPAFLNGNFCKVSRFFLLEKVRANTFTFTSAFGTTQGKK